jgi:hypothetical protein
MINYSPVTKIYTYLWNKYRPAILKLMVDADDGPQQYKFANHEFRNVNPREKGGYTFTLRAFQGKAVNNIRASAVAQDLLTILQQSRKASELMQASSYEFMLDKQFIFHIVKLETAPEVVVKPELDLVV